MAPDKDDEQGTPPPPIKITERRFNWLIISILSFVISAVMISLICFITYIILRDLGIL